MIALELFAGKRSFGKVAERYGYNVFSVEIDPKMDCNITMDVLDFDPKNYDLNPDFIWASPVCTSFSVASGGKHRGKDLKALTDEGLMGERLAIKTIEIIDYYKSKNSQIKWVIENPRGLLQKMDFMTHLEPYKKTITYCAYGHSCMKPTNIWTNIERWKPREMCSPGSKCHIPAPRGSSGGIRSLSGMSNRSIVPENLFHEILGVIHPEIIVNYH